MPDNRNWNRPIQIKFFVDERELGLIKAKMTALKLCAEEECPAEFQSSAGRFAIKHFGEI